MSSGDQVQLAALPLDLPETIKELIVKVRKNPAAPWPLKDAADMAGYSPFHFSRVFKSLVGYGFHEFVDRSRNRVRVENAGNDGERGGPRGFDLRLWHHAGLRESVKEYLGLVPANSAPSPTPSTWARDGHPHPLAGSLWLRARAFPMGGRRRRSRLVPAPATAVVFRSRHSYSRSLAKTIRRGHFEVRFDTSFER